MTNLVDASKIEVIVGVKRHQHYHYVNASRYNDMAYILHSFDCVASTPDLRDCVFSKALDAAGIPHGKWWGMEDRPIIVEIEYGVIVPAISIIWAEPLATDIHTKPEV